MQECKIFLFFFLILFKIEKKVDEDFFKENIDVIVMFEIFEFNEKNIIDIC